MSPLEAPAPERAALPQRDLMERNVAHAQGTPAIAGLLVFGSFATGTEIEAAEGVRPFDARTLEELDQRLAARHT